MPRTRSLAWSELKIGIVSVVALFLAGLMIFLLTGDSGFPWQRYALKTVFENIAGLKEGAPVRVSGVEVGAVTGIAFIGDRVEVTMELQEVMRDRITGKSIAALGSVSLLGEGAVDITSGVGGTPVPDWGYVKAGKTAGSIADVATQAGVGIESITKLMDGLNKGQGTIGKLLTDEQIFTDLHNFIAAAEAVTQKVNKGDGTLGRLVTNPAAAKALEGSLQNLEAVMAKLKAGEGSLGQLLNNDELSKSLTGTTANLNTLTGRLNKGDGTMGKLLTDDSLFTKLHSMSERLDTLVGQLNAGQGTAGQLLKDKQLYDNLNGTVTEMKGLVGDIRKDPKKYLNVKVSIF